MKKVATATAVATVLALAGCGQKSLSQSKSDAYDRWHHARAKVLYGAGREHLKVGQLDKAATKTRDALGLAPDYTDARILLGKVLIEQGAYSQAGKHLEQARGQAPESAEVHYLLAVAAEKAGDMPRALELYRKSHALDDSGIAAIVAAGEVMVQMDRLTEARRFIAPYLSEADGDPSIHELAGRMAMMQGDYAEAAEQFLQAHDLDYDNYYYRESLAQAQFLAQQYDRAADTIENLLMMDGYEPPAWVYTMLGNTRLALGRHVGARDAFEQVTRQRPSDPIAWTNLARSALVLGDMSRAVMWSNKALQLDTNCSEAVLLLGYSLLSDNQAHRAVRVLSEHGDRVDENPMVYWLLGRAYSAVEEPEKAKRCYGRAMELDPDHPLSKVVADGKPVRLDMLD
ncbi:MAG: tetratricopeptide repeat protein [Planctomycetota bacterium]